MNVDDRIGPDARLMVLQELAGQVDGRSNDMVLARIIDAHGIRRSRDWLRTQLRRLAELDAVRISEAGSMMVVALRVAGRDHVERRTVLEGVSRPAEED